MGFDIDYDFFNELLGKFCRNAFSISSFNCSGSCALSFCLKFSLFNHSCSPNVFMFNVGTTFLARALRPIPQEEELTINYVETLMLEPIKYRRKELRRRYLFDCTCPGCTSVEALEKDKIHRSLRVEAQDVDVRRCIAESKIVKLAAGIEMDAKHYENALWVLEGCIESSPLDRRSCYVRKLASLAASCCCELALFDKAFEFEQMVTEAYTTFSPNSRHLATRYMCLFCHCIVKERDDDAMRFVEMASEIYKANMGEHHPMTKSEE